MDIGGETRTGYGNKMMEGGRRETIELGGE